jgi:iron complex transport system permease protein
LIQGKGKNLKATVLLLVIAFGCLIVASLVWGRTLTYDSGTALKAVVQACGFDQGVERTTQFILELRLWRVLTAAGVGAALAYSGALLQGVFRNGLAAPSVIGVTAGASLGAALTIMYLGGFMPSSPFAAGMQSSSFAILFASFIGSFGSVFLVVILASERGRISVPSLLLTGIAVNACIAGLLSATQAYALQDYEISRAIFSWTFGNLDDKTGVHVVLIWSAVGLGAMAIPRLATELDLFAGGEDDARSLGVPTGKTKFLAISIASLVAATAVAVAGQIVFVGLVVPHIVRLVFGAKHQFVLPLSIVCGAVFLAGAECIQVAWLKDSALRPGVLMSLVGGPFFLMLLVKKKGALQSW